MVSFFKALFVLFPILLKMSLINDLSGPSTSKDGEQLEESIYNISRHIAESANIATISSFAASDLDHKDQLEENKDFNRLLPVGTIVTPIAKPAVNNDVKNEIDVKNEMDMPEYCGIEPRASPDLIEDSASIVDPAQTSPADPFLDCDPLQNVECKYEETPPPDTPSSEPLLPDSKASTSTVAKLPDQTARPNKRKCNVPIRRLSGPPSPTIQINTRSKEKPAKCIECDGTFANAASLKIHMKTHKLMGEKNIAKGPKGVVALSCNACGKTFSRAFALKNHLRIHTGERPYCCTFPECNKAFRFETNLKNHIITHQPTEDRPYKCKECDKCFTRANTLKRHNMMAHTESPHAYPCEECDKAFIDTRALKRHIATHAKFAQQPLSLADGMLPTSLLKPTMRSRGSRGGKKIPPVPIPCPECDRTFLYPRFLKDHYRRKHSTERPFVCDICGKSFITSSYLKRHTISHSEEKPFRCYYCDKTFTSSGSLKYHIFTHTGERPYQCSDCGKCFTQACSLKSHMVTHSSERDHQCSVCFKRFAGANYLKTHLKIHLAVRERPSRCDICEKTFTTNSALKKHLQMHTGQRLFQCSVCFKDFTTKGILKRHLLLHTGEQLYKCVECDKGFVEANKLKNHMVTHHSGKPLQLTVGHRVA